MGFGNVEQKQESTEQKKQIAVEEQKYSPEMKKNIDEIKKTLPQIDEKIVYGVLSQKENIEETVLGKKITDEEYNKQVINFFTPITQIEGANIYNDPENAKFAVEDFKKYVKNSVIDEEKQETAEEKQETAEEKQVTIEQNENKDLTKQETTEAKQETTKIKQETTKINENKETKKTMLNKEITDKYTTLNNWFKATTELETTKEILTAVKTNNTNSKWYNKYIGSYNRAMLWYNNNIETFNEIKKTEGGEELVKNYLDYRITYEILLDAKKVQRTTYKGQEDFIKKFDALETTIENNYAIIQGYKAVEKPIYAPETTQKITLSKGDKAPTTKSIESYSFNDFSSNPTEVINKEGGKKLLPDAETENLFKTDQNIDEFKGYIWGLDEAKTTVKEKILEKLKTSTILDEEQKSEKYFTDIGTIKDSTLGDIEDKDQKEEINKISREAREETEKETTNQVIENLNSYAHDSIIGTNLQQIGKYFSKENIGETKFKNMDFEDYQMKLDIDISMKSGEKYPQKIRYNMLGELYINNTIDFSENKCNIGINNGKETKLPMNFPSLNELKNKVKSVSPKEIFDRYKPKNNEEYSSAIKEEMKNKLESSFTYSGTNQLYVQHEIEKNNMIQNTTNNVISMLAANSGTSKEKILNINKPDSNQDWSISKGDPQYDFLKLLSDSGKYYNTKEIKECSMELETLATNIKNRILDETNNKKYTADNELTTHVFNKENFGNNNITPLIEFLNIFTKEIPGDKKETNDAKKLDIQALKNINFAITNNEKIDTILNKKGSATYTEKYHDFIEQRSKGKETAETEAKLLKTYDTTDPKKGNKYESHLIA